MVVTHLHKRLKSSAEPHRTAGEDVSISVDRFQRSLSLVHVRKSRTPVRFSADEEEEETRLGKSPASFAKTMHH